MHVYLVAAWGAPAGRVLATDVAPVFFTRRPAARRELVALLDAAVEGRGACVAACVDGAPVLLYAHGRALVVASHDYAPRVAFALARRVAECGAGGTSADLEHLLAAYQHPERADAVAAIQGDLDAVQCTTAASLAALLDRGTKLAHLDARSETLVVEARDMARGVRDATRCWAPCAASCTLQ